MNKHLLFAFLMIINNFISNTIYSQVVFSSYNQTNISEDRAEVVCTGDVNNDGKKDVIIGTQDEYPYNGHKIYVLLQDNQGLLSSPIGYTYSNLSNYSGTEAMAVEDINNDGLTDVVIGFYDSLCIFLQNSSGTLNPVQKFDCGNVGWVIRSISIGDLNNDGLNDIALFMLGLSTQNCISVFYQNSTGGFTVSVKPAPQYSGLDDQVKIADVNNDQLCDLVLLIPYYMAGMYFYFQNTTGYLNDYILGPQVPYKGSEHGFDVGDLNKDGINDIVVTESFNTPNARIVIFYYDPITNHFLSSLSIVAYDCPEAVRIDDLNCDGNNEIIVIHGGWNRISVYEQSAMGAFGNYIMFPIPYATHYNNQGMCIGDINNDSKKDIVVADYLNDCVILKNQSVSYNLCCGLPPKPFIPIGVTSICEEGVSSWYYSILFQQNVVWHIFPVEAGNIVFSNNDSCQIEWNNSWNGVAGIFLSATNTCGSRYSDTIFVTKPITNTLNLGKDTILCINSSISLNAGAGYSTYQWQNNSTDSVFIVTFGGIYYVEVTDICGSLSDTIAISEVPLPVVSLIPDTVLCAGTSIQLDVTLSGSYIYLWQDNTIDPVNVVTQPGIYSVNITDSNNCTSSDSVFISGINKPLAQLPDDTTFCGTINLELHTYEEGCSYLWQDSSTTSYYNVFVAGLYKVTISNICGTTIDSLVVTLIPMPVINFPNDTVFCTDQILTLNVFQNNGFNYQYLWQNNYSNPDIQISQSGNYSVHVSYDNICEANKLINVKEISLPDVFFSGDTIICSGNSLHLALINEGYSFLWFDGKTSLEYTVTESGNYFVDVTNRCGTVRSDIEVTIRDCSVYLDVPSAFSPNNDGKNDILYAVGRNIVEVEFVIYNRWGEKVFESKSLSEGWDGSYHGEKLNASVFIYYISGKSINNGEKIQKQGNVSLVK